MREAAASLERLPTEDYAAYEAAGQRFTQDKGQVRSSHLHWGSSQPQLHALVVLML